MLTDEAKKILAVAERSKGTSRATVVGSTYILPPQRFNTFSLPQESFFEILHKSTTFLVKAIARELGLGGIYAEELCFLSSIDKKMESDKLIRLQSDMLWENLQKLLRTPIHAVVSDNRALPFCLHNSKDSVSYPSFNAALDAVFVIEEKPPVQLVAIKNVLFCRSRQCSLMNRKQ